MGNSSSLTIEEVTLLPPDITLPLDITRLIFEWTQGVPKSLMGFYTLSMQLGQQLSLLPTKTAEIPEDWVSQSMGWSQGVLNILKQMHDMTGYLMATRPADLRGNFHPVEEYMSDIATTRDEFVKILRPLQSATPQDTEKFEKALVDIRGVCMFQRILIKREIMVAKLRGKAIGV